MKHLRKRPRLDSLVTQQRSGGAPWGRRIYLTLLTLLALAITDYFVGDALILSADGVLLADRHAVDAVFPARVAKVMVREGDRIENGQLLMKLESVDIQREIAELSSRDAELSVRAAQMKVDQSRVAALLPVTERWSKQASASICRKLRRCWNRLPTHMARRNSMRCFARSMPNAKTSRSTMLFWNRGRPSAFIVASLLPAGGVQLERSWLVGLALRIPTRHAVTR